MEKIKALLLPLALIFAAIAIFEFGVRYGASNTRAIALAGQLNNSVNLYRQVAEHADERSRANLEAVIDNHVVTAALERGAWYLRLRDEPKESLDQALGKALFLRGDAVMARFETMTTSDEDGTPKLSSARLTEISTALERAQDELITTAADPILP
jgi:hypothetical protein